MSVPLTLTSPLATYFHEKDLLNILAEIQSNPPTKEALAHAQSVIADTAADSTFRERILKEITNLAGTVLQIEADFASITLSISQIDDKNAMRGENGVAIKLLPQWTSYHNTYTSLLSTSQTTATQMKAKIDDLLVNLIPIINNPEIPLDDKKAELRGYVEDLEEFQYKASDKAREFLRLRQGIMNFKTNLVNQVVQQKRHVVKATRPINDAIDKLEKDLASFSKLLAQCWDALKLDVPTVLGTPSGVSGAVLCLSGIAPISGTFLLLAGLGAIGYYGVYPGVKEKRIAMCDHINDLKIQRDSLENRARDLEDIHMKLRLLNATFQSVVDQLGTMQTIWTLLKSDAVGLLEAIHQMQNAKTNAGFRQRIQNVEKLWQTLAWALDNYALGIASIN